MGAVKNDPKNPAIRAESWKVESHISKDRFSANEVAKLKQT